MVNWKDLLLPAAIVAGFLLIYRGGQQTLSDIFSAFGVRGGNGDGAAQPGPQPAPTIPEIIRETGRAFGLGAFEAGAGIAGGILAVRAARAIPFRVPAWLQQAGRYVARRPLTISPLGILALYPELPRGGIPAPGGGVLFQRTVIGRPLIVRTFADIATRGRIPAFVGETTL